MSADRGGAGRTRAPGPRTIWINGKFLAQDVTGTQRYALELTRRLLERHPDRLLLAVPHDASVPTDLDPRRVRRLRGSGQAFEQIALPWAARRDAVLSLGGPAPVLAVRQIVTMHDMSVFRFPQTYSGIFATWYRLMYRLLALRCDLIITVSEFSAGEIRSILGRAPDRPTVVVVPNGADHVDFVAPVDEVVPDVDPLPGSGDFVLCVGTFARHKNLAPVLDVLERRSINSVVVGARGDSKVFAATKGDRWSRATFTGRIADGDLVSLYQQTRALVFPSLYEGFGIPIVEAQRLGCPVVAFATASIPEIAGDGAILCDPGEVAQIADAVERLDREPTLRDDVTRRGRANADRFTWAHSVARLEEALGLGESGT